MALTLTYPEVVTSFNIEKMRKLIKNGPELHPGANYVHCSADNTKSNLTYANRRKVAEELQI
jgi:DNA-directed RNA polymerase III subunit RPC1